MGQLRSELDLIRRLDHPNIVRLQEVFETEDSLFLVMVSFVSCPSMCSIFWSSERGDEGNSLERGSFSAHDIRCELSPSVACFSCASSAVALCPVVQAAFSFKE